MNSHPLYSAALAADDAFHDACVAAGYKDRWHTPPACKMPPALRAAYDAKVAADAAWLAFMRSV